MDHARAGARRGDRAASHRVRAARVRARLERAGGARLRHRDRPAQAVDLRGGRPAVRAGGGDAAVTPPAGRSNGRDRHGAGRDRGGGDRRRQPERRRGKCVRLGRGRPHHGVPAQRLPADGMAELHPGNHHRGDHCAGGGAGSGEGGMGDYMIADWSIADSSIADCGLWITEWKGGRRIRNPKSAIRNPQSVGGAPVRIVDSHVHFWDPEVLHYPWLTGVPPLHRAFLPRDYAAATGQIPIGRMVFVEANCRADEAGREVEFVERLVRAEPRLAGIVAFVDLAQGGKPAIRDRGFEAWSADVTRLAAYENVCCKLSGLLTEAGATWCLEDLVPYAARVVECFGSERVLYGSDWPVLTLAGDYGS